VKGRVAVRPSKASQPDQELWGDLLDYIGDGLVVPIVGRDLLRVPGPSGSVPLTRKWAEQLAAELGVPATGLESGDPLNTVASRHLAESSDEQKIYTRLNRARVTR
jgi:hypothetical protein